MPIQLKTYYDWLLKSGYILLIIGLLLTGLFYNAAPEWATAFMPLVKLGFFLVIWHLFDKYGLKDYDTLEEIFVKKNMAFAVVFGCIFLGIAYIIK